jgi:hypothetical protein
VDTRLRVSETAQSPATPGRTSTTRAYLLSNELGFTRVPVGTSVKLLATLHPQFETLEEARG